MKQSGEGSILKGLTLKKVIVIVIIILVLKAAWSLISGIFIQPSPLDISSISLTDEFGHEFRPKSCEVKDGKCIPLDVSGVDLPPKGLSAYKGNFYLDARPFRIFSGSFHYFRTHPVLWGDRLIRMKAAGLNTVMTYVPWNLHERTKGDFTTGGLYNIVNFIEQVQKVGLYLIVRPGPFICAEWEFGGFPSWILRDPAMKLRTSSYAPFINEVKQYFASLFPLLSKFTYKHGGPIIAFQVENEFGSFWKDPAYLKFIVDQFSAWDLDELLFTSDGYEYLNNGTLPNILATVNFASDPAEKLDALKNFQPHLPLMVSEFWAGWFDHWKGEHHTLDSQTLEERLETILSYNASVNFYMFIGGTNFEFWNGANFLNDKQEREAVSSYLGATVTSYDYNAAVSEYGSINPKYHVIRNLLQKHAVYPQHLPAVPPSPMTSAYGKVAMEAFLSLENLLSFVSQRPQSQQPLLMEQLPINNNCGQSFGWLLYQTTFDEAGSITINAKLLDRAYIYINTQLHSILSYWDSLHLSFKLELDVKHLRPSGNRLEILIENSGRINYERYDFPNPLLSQQRKGLDGAVFYPNGSAITSWLHTPLEFNEDLVATLLHTKWNAVPSSINNPPYAFRGSLKIQSNFPAETFILLPDWHRGIVLINGFHLGRYWNVGPQRTLYVPSPILKTGDNDIIVFELESAPKQLLVEFLSSPVLG